MTRIEEWYFIFRMHLRNLRRNIKYFFQRGKRGYSDLDNWNLCYYLASWIPEAMDKLIAEGHSYPGGFKTLEEWNQVLGEIAWAFRAVKYMYAGCDEVEWIYLPNWNIDAYIRAFKFREQLNKDIGTYNCYVMTYGECKRMENGLKLFGENVWKMWD